VIRPPEVRGGSAEVGEEPTHESEASRRRLSSLIRLSRASSWISSIHICALIARAPYYIFTRNVFWLSSGLLRYIIISLSVHYFIISLYHFLILSFHGTVKEVGQFSFRQNLKIPPLLTFLIIALNFLCSPSSSSSCLSSRNPRHQVDHFLLAIFIISKFLTPKLISSHHHTYYILSS
jgi:hypothetical protein